MSASWWTHLIIFLCSSMASCGNSQIVRRKKRGGGVLTLLIFLGIIPLLDNMRRDLNKQWFILWCQTRISLSSRPIGLSVEQSLSMSSLVISAPSAYFTPPTSWWVVGIGYMFELGGRILPPGSSLGPKSRFSMCLPRRLPLCATPGWKIWVYLDFSGITWCLLGISASCDHPAWARKVLIVNKNCALVSVTWYVFRL